MMTSSNGNIFPRNWPFVRGIHRSPVNFPHKGQWRGALMFSLICAWIKGWINIREAGDSRRHRAHYYVTVCPLELKAFNRIVVIIYNFICLSVHLSDSRTSSPTCHSILSAWLIFHLFGGRSVDYWIHPGPDTIMCVFLSSTYFCGHCFVGWEKWPEIHYGTFTSYDCVLPIHIRTWCAIISSCE